MGFKKMEDDGVLPGPRAVLVSGFDEDSHAILDKFITENGISDFSVIPCREDSVNKLIEEVLGNQSEAKIVTPEKLPPVMLWSGITHQELDQILGNFKTCGLVRPIFATTTESNLKFSVKELLQHLLKEQQQMKKSK
ncbi:MAG: DUF3783 domain-containing protein [Spirochaetaceae bacterium]|jgi:hypothetical protein|nr:DUF3783 domain-containing protein [Spirochaetaceae bacterium]